MNDLLMELVARAKLEQAVALATLGNGISLMVYPLADELLVGVGIEGRLSSRVDANLLLQKRGSNMSRFGAWMPALFQDGSWYVTQRVRVHNPKEAVLSDDDLLAAEELLT